MTCPSGHFCIPGSTAPLPCSVGSHAAGERNPLCSTCAHGKYQDEEAQSACKECPLGYTCPRGSSMPLPASCAPGTFAVANLDPTAPLECALCSPGFECPGGTSAAKQCRPGTSGGAVGLDACPPCAAGSYQTMSGTTSCQACEPGSYCSVGAPAPLPCASGSYSSATNLTSAAECTPTAAGFFAPTGSTEQIACAAGTIGPVGGLSSCVACHGGTYQGVPGSTACVACVAGSYCPTGAAASLPCTAGSYSSATHLSSAVECTSCPAGHSCGTGSVVPQACYAGSYAANASKPTCDSCAAGSYQDGAGATACKSCDAGYYCERGCSSPLPCPGGTHMNTSLEVMWSASQCVECEPGTFCPVGSAQPTACAPGTYNPSPHAATCLQCEAGTSQNANGATACRNCTAGSYCPAGATTPLPCASGTYGPDEAMRSAADCRRCPAGQFCVLGSTQPQDCLPGTHAEAMGYDECVVCANGTFTSLEGSTACTVCSPGSWCTSDAEIACGENTYSPRPGSSQQTDCLRCPERTSTLGHHGATDILNCSCSEGYYQASLSFTEGRPECIYPCCTCPIGTTCDDLDSVTLPDLPIKSGYYRLSAGTIDVRRCPDAAANCSGRSECQTSSSGCAGGRSGGGADLCQPGLGGPFCRLCVEDYHFYVSADDEQVAHCKPCEEVSNSPNMVVLVVVACTAGLFACALSALVYRARQKRKLRAWLREAHTAFFATFTLHIKFKILVGFYQIITKIEGVYDLFLPAEIRELLLQLQLIISLGIDGIPLACVGARGYMPRLLFWSLVPIIVLLPAVAFSVLPILFKYFKLHKQMRPDKAAAIAGAAADAAAGAAAAAVRMSVARAPDAKTAPPPPSSPYSGGLSLPASPPQSPSSPPSPPPSPSLPRPRRLAPSLPPSLRRATHRPPPRPLPEAASGPKLASDDPRPTLAASRSKSLAATIKDGLIESTLPVVLRIFFLLYPIVTNVAFEGFSCYEFQGGEKFLVADVDIRCESEEHDSVRGLALLAILVYPVGLMLLNGSLLFLCRKAILAERPSKWSKAIDFLHGEYEKEYYWWELIEMLRRFLLVSFLSLLVVPPPLLPPAEPTAEPPHIPSPLLIRPLPPQVGIFVVGPYERGTMMQLALATLVCIMLLAFQLQANPFVHTTDDFLAASCSFCLAVTFLCCVCYKLNTLTELKDMQDRMSLEQKTDFVLPTVTLTAILIISVFASVGVFGALLLNTFRKEKLLRQQQLRAAKSRRLRWYPRDSPKFGAEVSDVRPPKEKEPMPVWATEAAIPIKQRWHAFLSHNWREGQSDMKLVKSRLAEMCPDLFVFLDVDNLGSGAAVAPKTLRRRPPVSTGCLCRRGSSLPSRLAQVLSTRCTSISPRRSSASARAASSQAARARRRSCALCCRGRGSSRSSIPTRPTAGSPRRSAVQSSRPTRTGPPR